MKIYKHSKFELIHIKPNEDIEKITFKRNFFLTKEIKDILLNNAKNIVMLFWIKKKINSMV